MIVVDGKHAVLGRLAGTVAKQLLKGEEITVVNADKIIITGDKLKILAKYIGRRSIGSPQHGPFFPKKPELIVKRTIRGMLPYKTPKGRNALKKLQVYVHSELSPTKSFGVKEISTKFMTVGELARQLGWRN